MRKTIKVKPNNKKGDELMRNGEEWTIYVREKAVEGRANAAVIKLLAKELGKKENQIEIVSGFKGRKKVVEIG